MALKQVGARYGEISFEQDKWLEVQNKFLFISLLETILIKYRIWRLKSFINKK